MGQQHSADSGLDKEERRGVVRALREGQRREGTMHRAPTPTKIPSGGQSKRLQGHFVAQAFQPPDQGSADSVHIDPIKVIRTEFPVVSYENTFRRSEQAAPRSLCGPGVPAA